jgi:uncharacterized protein involved in outer membrane biogenesis
MNRRRILRIAGWTSAVLVWIPFLVVLLTVMGINPLFTMAVTKLGSDTLKVPVTLRRASVSFAGKLSLGRFEIHNPKGYSEMEAASFDGLFARVPFRSVFFVQDMEIPVLTVENPVFNLEMQKGKPSNWAVIMKNLAQSLPKKDEPVPPDDEKRFKVGELKIINPIVYYRSPTFPNAIRIDLKDVELKQVGNAPGSRSKLYIVLASIFQAILTGGIQEGKDLPRDVKGALTEELSEMSKAFGDAFQGIK